MYEMLTLRHSKGISYTSSAEPAYHLSLSSEELAAFAGGEAGQCGCAKVAPLQQHMLFRDRTYEIL